MDAAKYKGKYRIPSARLAGYDYGHNGLYFVTICTKEKNHYFGKIAEANDKAEYAHLVPSDMGTIAFDYWRQIPEHYPFVCLDEFIIMPNHIHGIIEIAKDTPQLWKPNEFGIQSQNLSAIIRAFKSSVKKYANDNDIDFHWQARFHDHIIRDSDSLFAIRNYIASNPQNWSKEKNNSMGLKM